MTKPYNYTKINYVKMILQYHLAFRRNIMSIRNSLGLDNIDTLGYDSLNVFIGQFSLLKSFNITAKDEICPINLNKDETLFSIGSNHILKNYNGLMNEI